MFRPHPRREGPPPEQRRPGKRLYDSRWEKVARLFRQRNPLCIGCRAVGLLRATEVVDHIVPHEDDPALMWQESNWQPLCHWHHSSLKQRLEQAFKRGTITADDMRFDSAYAVRMTREAMPD